ncbi:hypothetical protein PAXRUDRAFT_173263, partial [Paxillus rubicundulus Ve08.2h10]
HILESSPILEGTWLDHPTHPQNIEETLEGPVGTASIFIDKALVSIVEGINIPIVTDTYDDYHLSCCLTHHQGYEKSSIGSKYDIHQFLHTDSIECNNVHPFHYTIKTLDPNDLHDEDNLSPVWDIPTIQKWNEVVDGIAHQRYWADHSRSKALHRSLARRSEMLAASLRENSLLPYLKKQTYDQISKDIKLISEKELGYKRIQREHQISEGTQTLPDDLGIDPRSYQNASTRHHPSQWVLITRMEQKLGRVEMETGDAQNALLTPPVTDAQNALTSYPYHRYRIGLAPQLLVFQQTKKYNVSTTKSELFGSHIMDVPMTEMTMQTFTHIWLMPHLHT